MYVNFKLGIGKFTLVRERPGVVSKNACWLLLHDCWLYSGETVVELLGDISKNWKKDRALIG